MKTCKSCGKDRPLSDFYGEKRNSDGRQGVCKACVKSAAEDWRKSNAGRKRETAKEYRSGDSRSRYLELKRKWHNDNRESENEKQRKRYASLVTKPIRNPVSPVKALMDARKRQLAKLNRTPKWANVAAMEEIYRDAAEFRAAGLDVHVDHIIPLRAKLASGLHVHQNLTIKLASWNDSKGNKYDPAADLV